MVIITVTILSQKITNEINIRSFFRKIKHRHLNFHNLNIFQNVVNKKEVRNVLENVRLLNTGVQKSAVITISDYKLNYVESFLYQNVNLFGREIVAYLLSHRPPIISRKQNIFQNVSFVQKTF